MDMAHSTHLTMAAKVSLDAAAFPCRTMRYAGSHGGGDDLIVIDIAGHDPRHGGGRDEFNDLDVISEHRGCRLLDECEALGGGWSGEYVGQFFEQRGAAVELRA